MLCQKCCVFIGTPGRYCLFLPVWVDLIGNFRQSDKFCKGRTISKLTGGAGFRQSDKFCKGRTISKLTGGRGGGKKSLKKLLAQKKKTRKNCLQ